MSRQDWRTAPSVFRAIQDEVSEGFDLDAAADQDDHMRLRYCSAQDPLPSIDLWQRRIGAERGDVFFNPPFGGLSPWIGAASIWAGLGLGTVAGLVLASVSSDWFHHALTHADVLVPDRRINYWHPDEPSSSFNRESLGGVSR